MEQTQNCRCSRPDLRDMGDYLCCFSCGLAPLATATFSDRKAEKPEITTDNNEQPSPPPYQGAGFIYKKLKQATEFRLLRLFPGKPKDDLVCELFHADISDPPAYEAVSYTWGDTTLVYELQTTAGLINITSNCCSTLRNLRHVIHKRTLWVDAICIAQGNDLEKNHQIPLMPSIYLSATQVLIYPGDHAAFLDTKYLFSLLCGAHEQSSCASVESQISGFLSLPWFSRIWILQEVAMARHAVIIVGSAALDWKYLSIANIHSLDLKPINVKGQVPVVLRISEVDKKPIKDIASMIAIARSCLSSDPRDRIYALLGLVHERSGIDLAPDYTRSAREIYADVTTEFLKAYNCLDFLSDIGQFESTSECVTVTTSIIPQIHHEMMTGDILSSVGQLQCTFDRLEEYQNNNQDKAQSQWPCYPFLNLEQQTLFHLSIVKAPLWQQFLDRVVPKETRELSYYYWKYKIAVNELREDTLKEPWIPTIMEFCKAWKTTLMAAETKCLTSAGEKINGAIMQGHGTLLVPSFLFGLIPLSQKKTDPLDKDLNLPSWVPDFRYHPQLSSFVRWRRDTFPGQPVALFDAGSKHHPVPSLKVRAIFIDKLQGKDCAPGQKIQLCNANVPVATSFFPESHVFENRFRQSLIEIDHGATLDTIRKFSSGRSVALTDASLAIVSAEFNLGDVIAVLYGGTVPYLLRPSPSEPDRFQFIGECYLHGVRGPQFAPNYAELLGWFENRVMDQGEQDGLPWRTIFLE